MNELDYNLWEREGRVYVAAYEVFEGKTSTQDPIFTEEIGPVFNDLMAKRVGITDWAGTDLWFTQSEWDLIIKDVFAEYFKLPAEVFATFN